MSIQQPHYMVIHQSCIDRPLIIKLVFFLGTSTLSLYTPAALSLSQSSISYYSSPGQPSSSCRSRPPPPPRLLISLLTFCQPENSSFACYLNYSIQCFCIIQYLTFKPMSPISHFSQMGCDALPQLIKHSLLYL